MVRRFSTSILVACFAVLQAIAATSAQTRGATMQCAPCSLSGQQPAPAGFDETRMTFVPKLRPVSVLGLTVQGDLIARVLQVSPLIVEELDIRERLVNRYLPLWHSADSDGHICAVTSVDAVDLGSKSALASLRFNDIISARIVMQDVPGGTGVFTSIRRIAGPVRYFHTPARKWCTNRSGRLLEYRGTTNDAVTVFADGELVYRNPQFRYFEHERLTADELADLMRAFASERFNDLPADADLAQRGPHPGITLVAARYQDVRLAGKEERLAPLVSRMKRLAERAISHTSFLLKTGRRQPLTILPWPYPQVSLNGFTAFKNRARARRQSPYGDGPLPGGLVLEERLDAAFVARLPVLAPMVKTINDPNQYVYFSEGDTLYRVRINPRCTSRDAIDCATFYALQVDPIFDIGIELLPSADRTYRVMRANGYFLNAESHGEERDLGQIRSRNTYMINRVHTYQWTSSMGLHLADLPPAGVTISHEEYERHKAIYTMMEQGLNLVENGIIFEAVRVCQLEPGVVDTCEVKQ